MSQETLEARVARLEHQMSLLMHGGGSKSRPPRDAWRETIGMFRGDPIFAEMIAETERRHEEERRLTRGTMDGALE